MELPKIIDAHMHLWDLSRNPYPWLATEPSLPRSYLLSDYLSESQKYLFDAGVHVQAGIARDLSVEETAWISQLSRESGFPLAIVGYVDLSRETFESSIKQHLEYPEFTGIRQILSDEVDYLSMPSFQKNLRALSKFNLSFDLHIHPEQMDLTHQLLAEVDCPVVLNHLGLPKQFDAEYHEHWLSCLKPLSEHPNLFVKLSGLAMFNPHWTVPEVLPFIESTLNLFGTDRCMFASNFPVDKLSKSFDEIYDDYFKMVETLNLKAHEITQLFHDNAHKFYFSKLRPRI